MLIPADTAAAGGGFWTLSGGGRRGAIRFIFLAAEVRFHRWSNGRLIGPCFSRPALRVKWAWAVFPLGHIHARAAMDSQCTVEAFFFSSHLDQSTGSVRRPSPPPNPSPSGRSAASSDALLPRGLPPPPFRPRCWILVLPPRAECGSRRGGHRARREGRRHVCVVPHIGDECSDGGVQILLSI